MDAFQTLGKIGFVWNVKHFRRFDHLAHVGKMVRGRYHGADYALIDDDDTHNLMPTEGLNYFLDTAIRNQAQLTAWYIAITQGNTWTPAITDTALNVVANSTESTAYSESTRQAYTVVAASGGVLTNAASPAVFTISGSSPTIYGGFISSSSTRSSTTGKICSAALFSSSKAVAPTDVLSITATITLTTS